MKTLRAFFGGTAFALWSCSAFAQSASGPVAKGTFVLGAERLTGIYHADASVDPGPTYGMTTVSFLTNTPPIGAPQLSIYAAPRVGFDGFLIDGLSLGGTFAVASSSISNDVGTTTQFLIAPRVGYAYMFSGLLGIWPRGGFSYGHASESPTRGDGSNSQHTFAFDVDVPLLITPFQNFGIIVGPLLDVGFGGSQTEDAGQGVEVTHDSSLVLFGLSSGIVGIF